MSKTHITTNGLSDVPGPTGLYHVPPKAMLMSKHCTEMAPHLGESWPCALSALWWHRHRRDATHSLWGGSVDPTYGSVDLICHVVV